MQNKNDADLSNVVKVDFKARSNNQAASCLQDSDVLNAQKRQLFDEWIAKGTVSVLFDARMEGVQVPREFDDRGDLRLNFCYEFFVPDFNFNDACIWGTLSFDSGEFFCRVPWESVYGLQSATLGQGAVWFESFPMDLDQVAILGFNQEMCDKDLVSEDEGCRESTLNNVVLGDFGRNTH